MTNSILKPLAAFSCILMFSIQAVLSQSGQPARYALGSVPNQTVWSDGSRAFLVHWKETTGVTMTLKASPEPKGSLSLELFEEPAWLFRYIPAPGDLAPFTITITASKAGQQASQSLTISPQAVLPPEASVFGTDKHTQPVISTGEVSVYDRASLLPESRNYLNGIQRNTRIIGETVEIEEGNKNGIYEAYCTGDRRDLKTMEIIAERVIIRSPLRLKQTDVTIWARELIFEDQGQIQTTPEEKLQSAGTDANGGKAGADGLPAGSITLRIGTLTSNTGTVNFDLTGGKGQPGGPGQHGTAGSSVNTYWSSVKYCDSGICKTHTAPSGYSIIYYYYTFAGATIEEKGSKSFPGDGTSAKASGKPGEGGAGGSLKSNFDVTGSSVNDGGASASPTVPATAPFSIYKGGAAGTPQKSQKVHFYVDFFQMKSTAENHTSKAGADKPVAKANTVAGANGSYSQTDSPLAWLNPLSLRKVLNRIQDDYLANHIEQAQERLADYAELLAQLKASPAWEALDPTDRQEFDQMYSEIQLLLQRLEAGLDYFGNPAGWVPMLSFEVNTTIFQNEIDRAIDTLYLTYWIGNKAATEQQRVNALSAARDKLREQLVQARTDYDAAVSRLPTLRKHALDLQSQIQTTQIKLQVKETDLLQDTREPSFVTGLRLGLKLSAMMCQMIPVYQPALGAAGEGLRVASDFDPDRPWDTIKSLPNIGSAYLDSDFEKSANDQAAAKDQIDPGQAEKKSFDYVSALQRASVGLNTGVADIQMFLQERKTPSAEMLAELERLKSISPEYKALLEEVEALIEENRKFSEELITTMQQIATLSDVMTQNVLAIDALNREIAPGAIVLDERATAYLKDMERRAYDRLLKYHYYMAKAFEYRLLKPYTEPLNLEGLIEKFKQIADLNSDHTITPDQFKTLKSVYEEKISAVAEAIFDAYNSNRPELSVPIRFNLSDAELAVLNSNGTITVNLQEAGFLPLSQENIRIVDLKIAAMTTEPVGGNYGSTAYVDLRLEHSGISNLKLDGRIYRFRHYNRLTANPIVWGGRYDAVDSRIDPIRPSAASDSLLRSLLSGDAVSDMQLYSRPSAWADLLVSRSFFDSGGRQIRIKSLRLEMQYDFTPRNNALGLRNLEVLVSAAAPDGQGNLQTTSASLLPFFTLGAADINGRQNGRGRFLRVFQTVSDSVQLSAPAKYGDWQFDRWTDRFGSELPGGPFTNPSLELKLQDDLAVVARFVLGATDFLTMERPVLQGNTVTLKWNGGAGTRLQSSTTLSATDWQDVTGSDGQSQFAVPISGSGMFFRAVRP